MKQGCRRGGGETRGGKRREGTEGSARLRLGVPEVKVDHGERARRERGGDRLPEPTEAATWCRHSLGRAGPGWPAAPWRHDTPLLCGYGAQHPNSSFAGGWHPAHGLSVIDSPHGCFPSRSFPGVWSAPHMLPAATPDQNGCCCAQQVPPCPPGPS